MVSERFQTHSLACLIGELAERLNEVQAAERERAAPVEPQASRVS